MDEVLEQTLFDEEDSKKEERVKKLTPLAKDVVMVLVKTIKATKMYLPNNPIYQKFREELKEKFDLYFKDEEYLSFIVKKFELAFLDQQVYHNPDKEDNIALMFYKDGIREFCFHSGITPEEINGFIDILKFDIKDRELDDDLVTLLWEKDFDNITYTVTEEATEDEAEEEETILSFEEEPEAIRQLEELRARSEQEKKGPGEGGGVPGMAAGGTGLEAGTAFSVQQDEEDFESRRGTFQAPDDVSLLSELTDIFYEILVTETDQARFEMVADSFTRALELFVNRGDIALATILVMKVQELLQQESVSQWSRKLQEMLDLASSKPMVEKVGAYIDQGGQEAMDVAGSYLRQLDTRATGPLVGLLETLESRKARKAVCDIIVEICKGKGAGLTQFLGHKYWFVIRNVAMVLGKIADPDTVAALGAALKHSDSRVRKEALLALAATGGKKAEDLIAEAISDLDKHIRNTAGRLLIERAPEKAFEKLHESISRKDFEDLEFEEKKDLLELFGRAGGEKAADMLSDKFKKKGLFKSQKKEDTRAAAAYGLAAAGGQRAAELLESEVDSKLKTLRKACMEGLRKLRQRGVQ